MSNENATEQSPTAMIDVLMLDLIRQYPGHRLNQYTLRFGVVHSSAFAAVERLISDGKIIRNRHSEQLRMASAPCASTPLPDGPRLIAFRQRRAATPRPTPARVIRTEPMSPALSPVQRDILIALENGALTTVDIGDALQREGRGLGKALAALRRRKLIRRDYHKTGVIWELSEASAEVAS